MQMLKTLWTIPQVFLCLTASFVAIKQRELQSTTSLFLH
ncbi:hypothetical protein K710_0663 [Streptococcus iniae SF1]|nr:hypothetical protein K710_0663 [Streptococcus iniae SF1]